MRKIVTMIMLTAGLLSACGQAITEPAPATEAESEIVGAVSTPTVEATVTPQTLPTQEQPTPTVEPETDPTADSEPRLVDPPEADDSIVGRQPDGTGPDAALVNAAQASLAGFIGMSADALQLEEVTAQGWPDGSIGCPAEGAMYPQVVTPGYLMIFSDGDARYEIHTGETDELIVLCENEQPTQLPPARVAQPAPSGRATEVPAPEAGGPARVPTQTTGDGAVPLDEMSQPMVDLATATLAQDLGISEDEISLIRIESVEWNDGSLGCPKPGESYLQVIIPGYLIELEAQGTLYEYHTDMERQIVRCDQ